ncbi:MAG: FAD-binding oxidoreductase [Bacteroidia bacterium]|nr:FAD-binding oxidoreductase [Bacteroidia bacterium]
MKITNWGNFPVQEAEVRGFSGQDEAKNALEGLPGWIARGLGRCYGDSNLNPHILSTHRNNHFLAFDPETGLLTCQSGVSLEDILNTFVPRGWFPPVTPGTKFITIGGAIAADVHGKNHHSEGSFSRHLRSFRLLLPSGEVMQCSPTENADAFWATCGGMGLTGLVLDATFQLKKIETSYFRQEVTKAKNLEDIMRQYEEAMNWTYSVAWIDCQAGGRQMGRSILNKGEFATLEELKSTKFGKNPLALHKAGKLTIPFYFPGWSLNPLTVKAFNILYYNKMLKQQINNFVHYDPFFYPLDGILHWNRAYGRKGFTQYQFVMPPETAYEGLKKVLEKIRKRGIGSPVTVLKWFGKQEGLLSFPMEGYTLALDFPITPRLWKFLDELDEIVLEAKGRLYLTKDVRMQREMFAKGYPSLPEWLEIKAKLDPAGVLRSRQSDRVGLT